MVQVVAKLLVYVSLLILVQISLSLLMIILQLSALSIGVDCSLLIPHFMVNTSISGMGFSIFTIAFFQVLKRAVEVSLTLTNTGEAMKSSLISLIMLKAFSKHSNCLLLSTQEVIYFPCLANRIIILRFQTEILKKILKCFLLVRREIYMTQSKIGLAELRINLDDPCKAIKCFFLIRTLKFKPITAVAFVITITIIDAPYIPQSKDVLGIKREDSFIDQSGIF